MIKAVVGAAVGLLLGGPAGAALALTVVAVSGRFVRKPNPPSSRRLVLLLLLVELRSGNSVLAALQSVSAAVPLDTELRRIARVATVSGLTNAIPESGPMLRPVVAQLARAQKSGAPLADTVRGLLDRDLAEERAAKLSSARSLPVKLMLPVTLLMLPGLVLTLYAPWFLGLLDELTGPFS